MLTEWALAADSVGAGGSELFEPLPTSASCRLPFHLRQRAADFDGVCGVDWIIAYGEKWRGAAVTPHRCACCGDDLSGESGLTLGDGSRVRTGPDVQFAASRFPNEEFPDNPYRGRLSDGRKFAFSEPATSQRRNTEVRLTLRWSKPDSNSPSHREYRSGF